MVPLRLFKVTPKTNFRRPRHVRRAFLLLIIFLLSGIPVANQPVTNTEESNVEWIRFDLPEDSIRNLVGELDESNSGFIINLKLPSTLSTNMDPSSVQPST